MFAKLSCTTFQSLKFVFYEKELKMKEIFIKLATASERILQRKHTSSYIDSKRTIISLSCYILLFVVLHAFHRANYHN